LEVNMTTNCRILFITLVWLICLIVVQPLLAQPAEPSQDFALRVIGEDLKAVPGVKLWATVDYPQFPVVNPDSPRGSARATTDGNGAARITMPARAVNVVATAPGFAPLFLRGVTLNPQDPTEIHLSTGQPIRGSVMTSDHTPVAGAIITARRKDFVLDYMEEFAASATADDNGIFTIEHAAAASYVLNVQAPAGMAQYAFEQLVVDVQPANAPAPVELIARPGAAIKGKLVGPAGVNVGNQRITVLIRLPQEIRWELNTDADGGFLVSNLPTDCRGAIVFPSIRDHMVVINSPQPVAGVVPRIGSLDLNHPLPGLHDGFEAKQVKLVEIRGYVRDSRGNPVNQADIIVEPTNRVFRSGANGAYTAQAVPGIETRLRIGESNTVSGGTSAPFMVKEDQNPEQNLLANPKPQLPHDGEISGKVVDLAGNPVGGAMVFLNNSGVLPRAITTGGRGGPRATWSGGFVQPAFLTAGADGTFRFDMLDPGTTDVWARQDKLGWGFVPQVKTKTQGLVIKLAPQNQPLTLQGTLLDPNDRPVAGAKLLVQDGYGRRDVLGSATTAADGKYAVAFEPPALSGVPGREYVWLACSTSDNALWRSLPMASVRDLTLKFKPSSHITGRVVGPTGKPVKGARVAASQVEDADWGVFVFSNMMASAAPFAESRDDGTFDLYGVPRGVALILRARHPSFGGNETTFYHDITAEQKVDDIKLSEEIAIEGYVRHGETGQPVAGATVTLSGDFAPTASPGIDRDGRINQTLTDGNGHYRLGGLDSYNFMDSLSVLRASLGGATPELEGQVRYTKRLSSGDQVRIDILAERPLAVREKEWRSHSGTVKMSTAMLAVVDDADPVSTGKDAYNDTLTIYDSMGIQRSQYKGLNMTTGGLMRVMAYSPMDDSIWLRETGGKRLLKFSRDAKMIAEIKDVSAVCLAIDPVTGFLWTLSGGTTLGSSTIKLFDGEGKPVADYNVQGSDLVYSKHDDCFWVAGQQLRKVDRTGSVLATASVRFTYTSSMIAVNESDGSVWVTERQHPQQPGSYNRVTIFEPDGRTRKQIDGPDFAVAVDAAHQTAWTTSRYTDSPRLTQYDLNGTVKQNIPLKPITITIEPDTGYAWAASETSIDRIDVEGKAVGTIAGAKPSQKLIMVIP
jgi:protocatechuate 3,4-dioxygenase beta subunit